MLTPLDYIFKFLGLALGIAVVVAWFYAYAKTKMRGFLLIALAGVLKFVGWLSIAVLVAFIPITPTNAPVIFRTMEIVTLAIDVFSFVLTIWGIISIVNRLSS